jgi:predicted nuclease with TOPRIM domain
MSDSVTKQDLQELRISISKDTDTKVSQAVDDLSEIMQSMMQQISGEFDKAREERNELRESIDRLTNTLDGFAKRVEDAEQENASRDAQFERLLDWAKKVSVKTGIPLENL